MKDKFYIQAMSDKDEQEGDVLVPSSAIKNVPISSEMINSLKEKIRDLTSELTRDSIDGWSIEKIELGVSFSTEMNS